MALAFRADGDPGAPVALFVHGWPGSSATWRAVLPAVAEAGWRAVAVDLPGHGDSPLEPYDGTWEDHVRALDDFAAAHDLHPQALVVHDWGGLIGLRWALDRNLGLRGLVLSCTGFFADGRWHGLAETLRGPMGEASLVKLNPTTFAAMVRASSPGMADEAVEEFWKGLADEPRRRAVLALYRSGDFEKLTSYEPRLPELGGETLLLWGGRDRFAPVAGAHRFAEQLPDTRLVVLEEAGHFLQEDDPGRVAAEIAGFLAPLA